MGSEVWPDVIDVLAQAGARLARARMEAATARVDVRAAALAALGDGVAIGTVAMLAGVHRQTVHEWRLQELGN